MKYNVLMLKQHSILFVEDDMIMLQETSEMLKIFFSNIFTASSIQAAMESYYSNKPSVILTDLGLPDGDGLRLIQKIRKEDKHIPIIILSSHSDQEHLLQAANSKIDGYLIKPLQTEKLLISISEALENHKIYSENLYINHNSYYNYKLKTLYIDEQKIPLGKKELALFELFLQYPNKVLSKEEIISSIWPDEDISESAFKNLLSRLRQKVGQDLIKLNYGLGWYLETKE